MLQTATERRCALRRAADHELTVRVPAGDGRIVGEHTLLSDISPEGLSFITRHPEYYVCGQPVMLQIRDTQAGEVTVFGRIVWMSDPDISTCGEMIQPRVGVCLSAGEPPLSG